MNMSKSDYVLPVFILLIVVVGISAVYSVQVVGSREHECVCYVIGYSKYWFAMPFWRTDIPLTKVVASYQVLKISDSDGGLVVDTFELHYGGHYDFELGKLYKIYSEGNFWWEHRKITKIELLG